MGPHPNIVKVLAFHEVQLIFQREEMDLEDLWQGHPFSKLEAVSLALGVAKAAVAIHSKNFIHRDIKLANILVLLLLLYHYHRHVHHHQCT